MRHCWVSAKSIMRSICARRKLTCCSYPDCHVLVAPRRTLTRQSVAAAPWEASFSTDSREGVGVHLQLVPKVVGHLELVGEQRGRRG